MESNFYDELTASATVLKIPRSEILNFPKETFFAVLYDRSQYTFEEAYLAGNFELVEVIKVDRGLTGDEYGRLRLRRGKGNTSALSFTGTASNYRIRLVENITNFNGIPVTPQEIEVTGTSVTINHNFESHPGTITILDSDGVEHGKSAFEVKRIDENSFSVDFKETVTNWKVRFKL